MAGFARRLSVALALLGAGTSAPAWAGGPERPSRPVEWMPTLRVSPGAHVALAGAPEGAPRFGFGLEIDAGALIAPPRWRRDGREMHPGPWVWPMVGYQWVARPGVGHGVYTGLGLGWGTDFFAVFYTPRVVLAGLPPESRLDAGFRHGPSFQVFWGSLGVELSHGVHVRPPDRHDLRIALNINVAMIAFVLGRWASL